jgi:hypothetical protein
MFCLIFQVDVANSHSGMQDIIGLCIPGMHIHTVHIIQQ